MTANQTRWLCTMKMPKSWDTENVMEKQPWTPKSCCFGPFLDEMCIGLVIFIQLYRERFCEELPSHRKRTNRTGKGAKPCERQY